MVRVLEGVVVGERMRILLGKRRRGGSYIARMHWLCGGDEQTEGAGGEDAGSVVVAEVEGW
jgi:hypothetical protein